MLGCIFLAMTALPAGHTAHADVTKELVYIGTYTGKGSEGIYVSELDTKTGQLSEPRLAAKVTSPSFLAVHPSQKYLYAVSEVGTTDGKKGGGVTAFAINRSTGDLTKLNAQLSGGGAPCYIAVDRSGKCVMVANYSGGSVTSLPINEDGSVGSPVSLIQHQGSRVNKQRQEAAHAHSINVDAGNKYAFAADLGMDEIRVYQLDAEKASLKPHISVKTPVGGGPRHFAFHPNGKFAYCNNELTSSVNAFAYNAEHGDLKLLGTTTTLPASSNQVNNNSTAEVRVHPSGKFLYVSNRGHDSIALFQIQVDGTLVPAGHVSTQGKTPRNFGLNDDFLLAANQDSNSIVAYRIDPKTGGLTPTHSTVKVSMPVCVVFVKR